MAVAVCRTLLTRVICRNTRDKTLCGSVVRYNRWFSERASSGAAIAPELRTNNAAVLKTFSTPLLVESVDLPETLRSSDVLIKVHYCAVNAADVLLSKNLYTFEPSLPIVLGYELVGELVWVGNDAATKGYKLGDRVLALNRERYGGLSEQCVAHVEDIWKVPSGIKSLDAVCLLDNYITALIALERNVIINEDDMILVNVGASGSGLAAVDLATNVYRAKVIGICATEDGTAVIRDKGAFASLKYKNKKLEKQIEQIAAERNITAVFDGADGDYFKNVLKSFTDIYKDDATLKDLLRDDNFAVVAQHLSREGRVVIVGSAVTMVNADADIQEGTFSVSGFNLQEYRLKNPDIYRQAGEDVLQFFEEGLITPTCSLVAGLNRVSDVIDYVVEKKTFGKAVIDVTNKEDDVEIKK